MSRKTDQTSYLFDAFAYAATGRLTHPVCDAFPTQGMCVVPIEGGFGSARVEKFNFRDIVRFESATSSVTASSVQKEEGRTIFHSRASVEILNYSVLGVIHCGRVFFNLSTHYDAHTDQLTHFLDGSLDDLYIAGKRVDLQVHYPGKGALICDFKDHGDRRWHETKDCEKTRESCTQHYVENFGTITLGRIRMKNDKLRVQMIKYELGCPESGDGEAGGGGGNGSRWP